MFVCNYPVLKVYASDLEVQTISDKNPVVKYYEKYNGKTVLIEKDASVKLGKSLKLPDIPAKAGYASSKWFVVKNGKRVYYATGKSVKIEKNTNIYVQYTKKYTVTLYNMEGKVYKKSSVKEGGSFSLPAIRNSSRFTFMGWSLNPYQTLPCKYFEAGEIITVKKNISLYPVMYKRNSEKDLSSKDIPKLTKYSNLIMVGDSRTARTQEVLVEEKFDLKARGISFVAQSGEGLVWFKKEGEKKLWRMLNTKKGKTAIVFNLGVNSLSGSSYVAKEYIEYMNELAVKLKKKNVDLYYMSVNPLNSEQFAWYKENHETDYRKKYESVIREFNQKIKSGLAKSYTYIDTYSYLMKYGYVTARFYGSTRSDDGIHYTAQTYKRILNYVIRELNK